MGEGKSEFMPFARVSFFFADIDSAILHVNMHNTRSIHLSRITIDCCLDLSVGLSRLFERSVVAQAASLPAPHNQKKGQGLRHCKEALME